MISPASTLDVASVAVNALIPLAIFAAGALLAKEARSHEEKQWLRRKKYDTKLERWQEISPLLNDLLCFFMCFGHFREVTPPEAIKRKRQLDKAVHANRHIFGGKFMDTYNTFMGACFTTYVDVATNAKLRASLTQQRAERGRAHWDEQWAPLFVTEGTAPGRDTISDAYEELLKRYDEL